MGAVSILVDLRLGVICDEAGAPGSAALELWVVDVDAGVDDVRVCPLARALVVHVGGSVRFSARDPGETPGRIGF